ncbi:MAG: tRNA dihydrouridine synthase DusB [Deltaproteobacteria bacterium]|nr:tRNA dihydrouridine synthase DusB [Deltaproteobacteria bacterium]
MKIGNIELDGAVALAPMAGITDPPFRRTVLGFGISCLWTEMISCNAVVHARKVLATMDTSEHTVPVVFQIIGKDPEIMAECARIVEDYGAAAVDINMGCPARQVIGSGGGVALMRDLKMASRIIVSVRKAIKIPLTVKMRTGWDEKSVNAPELALIAEREGVDAIVLHARNRCAGHCGPVSLDHLKLVKSTVSIPVIGNGGVMAVEDAQDMVMKTGCDGIMIGKGALGRPWFPRKILEALFDWMVISCQSNRSLGAVVKRHFEDELRWCGVVRGLHRMRKHLGWYSKGIDGAAEFRSRVFTEENPEMALALIDNFFGKVMIP